MGRARGARGRPGRAAARARARPRAPPALAPLLALLLAMSASVCTSQDALARLRPELVLDPGMPASPALELAYVEGQPEGAAVCGERCAVRATGEGPPGLAWARVRLTNARDGALEALDLALPPQASGVLKAVAGEGGHALELLPAGGAVAAPEAAFEAALRAVRFVDDSRDPDLTPRVVVTTLRDAAGRTSAPAMAVVSLQAVNDPPELDLNGPNLEGRGNAVRVSEAERRLSVALVHQDATLVDADDALLARASAELLDVYDGAAERLTVSGLNTSILVRSSGNSSITLEGRDFVHNYLRVLKTLRYSNGAFSPTANVTRVVQVSVEDLSGAAGAAQVDVDVEAIRRIGADVTVPLPVVCSGNGQAAVDGLSCECNLGYEGELCEIAPCNDRGALTDKGEGGLSCTCDALFSGPNCTVACSNHGRVSQSGECECFVGWAGEECQHRCPDCDYAHSRCAMKGSEATCVCEAQWMGSRCDLQCPCPKHARGECSLDNTTTSGEERAVCACEVGFVGSGCEYECPNCDAEYAECVPPLPRPSERAALQETYECITADGATRTTAEQAPRALMPDDGIVGSDAMGAVYEQYVVDLPWNEALYRCMRRAGVPWGWLAKGVHRWAEGHFKSFRWPFVTPASEGTLNATSEQLISAMRAGRDAEVATLLYAQDEAARTVRKEVEHMAERALDILSAGGAVCRCDAEAVNSARSVGWAGHNCTLPCVECLHGSCDPDDGSCMCEPGWAGDACDEACSGNGAFIYVNSTVNVTTFDSLPYVDGVGTEAQGLMNMTELFGLLSVNNETMAYCACEAGWTGPYCEVECGSCSSANGECHLDGATGEPICVCDESTPNARGGVGFAGEACTVACQPCGNGTCAGDGSCACLPGYAGSTCSIECGPPEGPSRGTVNLTKAALGEGLQGSTAACECDYMWTGDMCEFACPNTYDTAHGRCEPPVDISARRNEESFIVCDVGWTGLDTAGNLNCSLPCEPCANGVCQVDGACLCDYGYLWQGPWAGNEAGQLPFPSMSALGYPQGEFHYEYHNCSVLHPCNQNGEWVNATCGLYGNGTVYNGTNCEAGSAPVLNGTECTGRWLFGMQYNDEGTDLWEIKPTNQYLGFDRVWLSERTKQSPLSVRKHQRFGEVIGGVCVEAEDVDADPTPLPLYGGTCLCDSIRNGRYQHPSGAYDFYNQGWAGPGCEIPCAPCSERGLCDALTGECVCHEGWTGYRCMTPCEPCEFGACMFDGSCLCDGERRLQDGTMALRLTRDPFYLERGIHEYTVRGTQRSRYVHPAYMSAAAVEDYLHEAELECARRPQCVSRTEDTRLPLRPNESFFRYGLPEPYIKQRLAREHAAVAAAIVRLEHEVENVPQSMNNTALCDKECMAALEGSLEFSVGPLGEGGPERGRSLESCGDNYAEGVQPWYCDSVVKAHFIREARLAHGRLSFRALKLRQEIEQEERWLIDNLNDRQAQLNTYTRGAYNTTLMQWVPLRTPSYYYVWIAHQLMYGVTADGGYSGWNCSVPCDACDAEHGTCQFDGSCECELGWYGDDCSKRCECFRHGGAGDTAVGAGLGLEVAESTAGLPIQAHGTCQRDGSCKCYRDEMGVQWTGADCFTKCAPCAHGECQMGGSCRCDEGWAGADCSVREYTECLPCDRLHGSCLVDGTCKCDKWWTGLDCSIPCWPCENGDCQLDGSCLCWPGWSLQDCSKHVGHDLVRSDFASGTEGWRAYNNSCAGQLQQVRTLDPNYGLQRASVAGVGCPRDEGVAWDPHMEHLWLSDRLPEDMDGEVAYFRAPLAFLGDKSGVYNLTLVYELHVGEGVHLAYRQGAEHGRYGGDVSLEPATRKYKNENERRAAALAERLAAAQNGRGAGMDVILVGGRPVDNTTEPNWAMDKYALYDWSRARFPELRLNRRWTKDRVASTVREYMHTPQMYVGIKATDEHATPRPCAGEHCPVYFNFDVLDGAGWQFLATIPKGFGWTDNEFVAVAEGTHFVKGREGVPAYQDGGVPRWDFERGETWRPDDMAAAVGGRRTGQERRYGVSYSVQMNMQAGGQSDNFNFAGAWTADERRGWDMLPEVYDAIEIVRSERWGEPAGEDDLRELLASLTELLIRADYYSTVNSPSGALGVGELVRMDHVSWAKRDKHEGNPAAWEEVDHDRYMDWLVNLGEFYQSAAAQDYVAQKLEERRLSICSGNGVKGDDRRTCVCNPGYIGDECEFECLPCVHGVCGTNGTCACDVGWTAPLCDIGCPPCDEAHGECIHLPELDARYAGGYGPRSKRRRSPYHSLEELEDEYNWNLPSACKCDVGWGGAPYNGAFVDGCSLSCPNCNLTQSACDGFTGSREYQMEVAPPPGEQFELLGDGTPFIPMVGAYEALCRCDDGIVGLLCDMACPDCGDKGVCGVSSDGDLAVCECECFETVCYTGANCQLLCPSNADTGLVCSGVGTCSTRFTGGKERAVCDCDRGYMLNDCSFSTAVCGNFVREGEEECDSGDSGDGSQIDPGCADDCTIVPGYRCDENSAGTSSCALIQ